MTHLERYKDATTVYFLYHIVLIILKRNALHTQREPGVLSGIVSSTNSTFHTNANLATHPQTFTSTFKLCILFRQIFGLMSIINCHNQPTDEDEHYRTLMVMGVRLASYNQILDPWVYILLRRAVLRKIYQLTTGRTNMRVSTLRRWEISSLQSSEKNTVKRI